VPVLDGFESEDDEDGADDEVDVDDFDDDAGELLEEERRLSFR
jgi:hypothetical protein